jgi:hypothetical protein
MQRQWFVGPGPPLPLLLLLHQSTPAPWAVWADSARAASLFHGDANDGGAVWTAHQRRVKVLAELDIDQEVFPAGWACSAVVLLAH